MCLSIVPITDHLPKMARLPALKFHRTMRKIYGKIADTINFPEYEVWLCPACDHPDWFGFIESEGSTKENYPYDWFKCRWCGTEFPRLRMKHDTLIERVKRWIKHTPLDGRFGKNFNTYPYKKYW